MSPSLIRKDFISQVKKEIGDVIDSDDVRKLVDLMFSGQVNGTYWNNIALDRKMLERKILQSDKSFKKIFEIIITEDAEYHNKSIPGAKFPVHFSYLPTIMDWFPRCKIIFLLRDPRAMYVSNMKKHTKKTASTALKPLIAVALLAFTIIEFKWAVRIHRRFCSVDNYMLFRFEDTVANPDDYISRLCQFLNVQFTPDLLSPPIVDSSYQTDKTRGFDKTAIHRWEKHISPFAKTLIELLAFKEMRELGYIK